MYSLFVEMLNRNLTAGLLVLVILIVRFFMKNTPKKYSCLLWALVAVRLLCPFTLSSNLSAFNLMDDRTTHSGQVEFFEYNGKTEKPEVLFRHPTVSANEYTSMYVEEKTSDLYLPTVVGIWTTGSSVMLLYAAFSYLELRRKVAASISYEKQVYICEEIPGPFIFGIFRPVIYLSSGLSEQIKKSVIAHERAHLSRKDHWWKPLSYVLLSMCWYNPMIWIAYILFCRDMEAACDEKVIAQMEKAERIAYSEALLACAIEKRFVNACPVAFGENDVKARVKRILYFKKPAVWVTGIVFVLICAVSILFLTNPLAKDSLICVPVENAMPGRQVFFKVDLGQKVNSMIVTPELWQDGICQTGAPTEITQSDTELNLFFHYDDDGITIQLDTDRKGAAGISYFDLPSKRTGWTQSTWGDDETLKVQPGQTAYLAVVNFDLGNGVRSCSCDDLISDSSRLRTEKCILAIRAEFFSEPPTLQ